MHHPHSRDERRAVREQIIAHRKNIHRKIWKRWDEIWHEGKPEYQRDWKPFDEWGRYAKWNLNCGCTMCHSAKYFKHAHKRRKALHRSESQAEFRRLDRTEG
jgi:hypothetical protein